jgi:Arc/MetJ-type ribon-helix-helix transcriptional regulator
LQGRLYDDLYYTCGMSETISVRLDEPAQQALRTLEQSGLSRSDAVRRALLDAAAALARRHQVAAEVAALRADEDDVREMREVAAFMESMRAPR